MNVGDVGGLEQKLWTNHLVPNTLEISSMFTEAYR